MTILEVSVSRYSLVVDTADTIRAMLENAGTSWGRRLHDALAFAVSEDVAYAVAPYSAVALEDFRPDAPISPDRPDVADRCTDGVLRELERAGFLTTRTVWCETSSEAYLSDGRTVTAVHVVCPFALVGVRYWLTSDAHHRVVLTGHAYADRWEITDRTYQVPAGWYLVGETGDYTSSLVGVAGMTRGDDTDPHSTADGLTCWLDDVEGFGASYCAAECPSCHARWMAQSGSWHFRPDDCDVNGWNFDDATDFDEEHSTVACPSCGSGRVSFMIF